MSTLQPQSLRKHRQTLMPGAAEAQQQQRAKNYGQLTVPGMEQLPNVGLKDKKKVGELVKRRFSSRVPAMDQMFVPMPMPNNAKEMIAEANELPESPIEKPPPRQREDFRPPERKVKRDEPDRETIEEPNFDAQRYISQQLSEATNVDIAKFADRLQAMQGALVTEQKEAMYKNYKTFLHVGKEITYLGTEIEDLRKVLHELHSATSAMREDAETVLAQEAKQQKEQFESERKMSVQSTGSNASGGGMLGVPPRRGRNAGGNRSSMIFLEEDYGKQLASLYRHVEGARQYLPNSQGRRVVKESGGWYQLNAATWKPFQPVSLFLLNDHLLVATKKKVRHGEALAANPSGQGRLVADQCWPLADIEITELVPRNTRDANATRALCIKAGAVQFVYRADKPQAHGDFYPKLKQVKLSLKKDDARGLKREDQVRLQNSMDYYAQQTPSLKGHRSLLENYSSVRKSSHSRAPSVDFSGGGVKSLRELDELINDLDVKIAYRNFSEAAEIVSTTLKSIEGAPAFNGNASEPNAERINDMSATAAAAANGNHQNSAAWTAQVLRMKLEQRSQQLVDILLNELSQDYLSKKQIDEDAHLLVKLGAGDRAKKTLLESRKSNISKRIKQVEFQGDTANYMTQIAIIYFRVIRATVDIYNNCFTDPKNSSALVDWAKNQLEEYVLLFARQLFNIDSSDETYKICAKVTKRESEQLKDVGLDLTFMLTGITDPKKKQ